MPHGGDSSKLQTWSSPSKICWGAAPVGVALCSKGSSDRASELWLLSFHFSARMEDRSYHGWLYIMCLGALLLLAFFSRLAHCWSMWWEKMRIQRIMKRQGISGPPLMLKNLFTGHAQDMGESRKKEMESPDLPVGTHDVESKTQSFIKDSKRRYGNPSVYWWGVDATISTTDAEVAKAVLVSRFSSFTPSEQLRRNRERTFGNYGLVNQQGDKWAHQRRLLNPAFHMTKLKGMVEKMDSCATQLIDEWEQLVKAGGGSAHIDVADGFTGFAADVLARTAFGSSYKIGQKIFDLSTELSLLTTNNAYYSALPLYKYLPTERNRRSAETRRALEDNIRLSVLERMKCGDAASSEDDDLLGLMIKASREFSTPGSKSDLSLEYLLDECKTFYFAGHETANGALQWTMMLLALHPEWQDKVRSEVDEVTQGKPGITADMISKLKVVTMVLSESLRLYPPASNLTRQAVEDVQVGDLFIPKGVCVYISVLAMHTMPEFWGQDALQFKPDRFKDGVTKACTNPIVYMPFSRGPRRCFGQDFMMTEGKVVLARILQSFRFALSPEYRHVPHIPMFLKPKFGVPLIVSKR